MDKVLRLLNERQLVFERVEESTIAVAFSTRLSDDTVHGFPLFIQHIEDSYGDRYFRFNIVPFVDQPSNGYPAPLCRVVCQANHDLPQLKFAFDGDGDLELILDVAEEALNDVQLDTIMQLMADHASTYYPELSVLVA